MYIWYFSIIKLIWSMHCHLKKKKIHEKQTKNNEREEKIATNSTASAAFAKKI